MTFFRDFPVPELPPRPRQPKPVRPEWSGAPDDELPAVVHLGQFLHRSRNRVLAVRSAQAFSTGCTFDVAWFIRRADESDQDWEGLKAAFFSHGHDPRHALSGTGLLFGVEFSDGSKASTAVMHMCIGPHDAASQPMSPVVYLQNRGGGGGDDELSGSGLLWLWPLPSAGDLRLVAQWTDMGMSESSIIVDGKQLRDASSGAEKYWPEEGRKG